MSGRKYPVMWEGPDGWCDWIAPIPGYRFMCCDCGLVHEMEFRIVKQVGPEDKSGTWPSRKPREKRLRVAFRARRDKRATAGRRSRRSVNAQYSERKP